MSQTRLRTSDINLLSKFLSHPQIPSLSSMEPVDCIVICVSAVLQQATVLLQALEARPNLTKTLVLCGGIGHSTPSIYTAVAKHSAYRGLAAEIEGKPEARVLQSILKKHSDVEKITSHGCRILVEDQSTNGGQNASFTMNLLKKEGIPFPKTVVLLQDPTMALRNVATFERTFGPHDVEKQLVVKSAPVFVPLMRMDVNGEVVWDIDGIPDEELWDKDRFYDLLIGEIPMLRDDVNGYGPKGRKFLVHVDIPQDVEEAWSRLSAVVGGNR